MNPRPLIPLCLLLSLAACDLPGLGPDPRIAQRDADGRAVGAACRQAMRGIEDCYRLNERALKSSIVDGWKEMDQYMRDNKIEGTAPSGVSAGASEEIIIDEKTPKNAGKDKAAAAAGAHK